MFSFDLHNDPATNGAFVNRGAGNIKPPRLSEAALLRVFTNMKFASAKPTEVLCLNVPQTTAEL